MKRAALTVVLFAILSLLVIPLYPHFVSPNEFARWALAVALVEHHTTELTQVATILGPRFEDLSTIDGRLYSNKAPGATLVGTMGYVLARPFTTSIRPLLTAMRLVASTLPLILLALLMITLAKRLGHEDRAPLVVAALLFGTPLFAYGLLLFAHALVARRRMARAAAASVSTPITTISPSRRPFSPSVITPPVLERSACALPEPFPRSFCSSWPGIAC